MRGVSGLKTNYMAYIDDFQTKGPTLDFNVSLDRAYQDIKLCLRGFPQREQLFFVTFSLF